MREIKFRAWDAERKFFLSAASFGSSITPCEDKERTVFLNHRDNIILMQFTGLQDKNGKDIYEGDVFYWGADRGKVTFEKGCFIFRVGKNYSMTMRDHYPEEVEIIGNIFEHPELLTPINPSMP